MSSWQDQVRQAVRTKDELEEIIKTSLPSTPYSIFIPKLFLEHLLSNKNTVLNQFLPHPQELANEGLKNPIGDKDHLKVPGFIHRYSNRALFTPTTVCPIQCRYCFRKNELHHEQEIFKVDFKAIDQYLKLHPEIDEIIFTGGDPLMLSDKKLSQCLEFFSQFAHIKWIRFHTRMPIIIPERLTSQLKNTLNQFREHFQFIFVLHTNHIDEIMPSFEKTIVNWPFMTLSQSVLLKGINNEEKALIDLFRKLASLNVKPYYLHHPDRVKGAMHFSLSLEEGRKLYAKLHNKIPGWMLPQYIIDSPRGKVSAFNPESIEFSGTLLDRFGQSYSFTDRV